MTRIILTSLLLSFCCYTVLVYLYCDTNKIPPGDIARNGWAVWQKNNCQSCHQVYGLGGYMGPDLTNIAAVRDRKHLYTFIKYGTGRMPNLQLPDEDVNAVIEWLSWVNKTGETKVAASAVRWTGTYSINKQQ